MVMRPDTGAGSQAGSTSNFKKPGTRNILKDLKRALVPHDVHGVAYDAVNKWVHQPAAPTQANGLSAAVNRLYGVTSGPNLRLAGNNSSAPQVVRRGGPQPDGGPANWNRPSAGSTSNFNQPNGAAIRAFQAAHGLVVDGIAGPKTLAAMHPQPQMRNAGYSATNRPSSPILAAPGAHGVGTPRSPLPAHSAPRPTPAPRGGGVNPAAAAIAAQRNALNAQKQQQDLASKQATDIGTRANYAASVEIDPQQQALQRQATQSDQQFKYEQAAAQAGTTRTVNEQQQMYGALASQLQGQLPQVGANYDNANSSVQANFQKLQDAVGANYDKGVQGTNDIANRLGLQAAAPQATERMGADQAFLKSLTGSDAAVAKSGLGEDRAASIAQAMSQISGSRNEGAALSGNTLRDANQTANAAKFTEGQKISDLLGQAQTLEGTRKGKVYENTAALTQLAEQARAAAEQAQFQRYIDQGNLDVKNKLAGFEGTKINNAAAYQQGQLRIDQQKVNIQAQQTKAQLQKQLADSQPGSQKYAETQAAIDLKNAQAAKSIEEAKRLAHPNAAVGGSYGSGTPGALKFLNDDTQGIDPTSKALAIQSVNYILNHNDVTNLQGYTKAVHEMTTNAHNLQYTPTQISVMLRALAIASNRGI